MMTLEQWLELQSEVSKALRQGGFEVNKEIKAITMEMWNTYGIHRDSLRDIIALYIVEKDLISSYNSDLSSKGRYITGIARYWLKNHLRELKRRVEHIVYEHELPEIVDEDGNVLPDILEKFLYKNDNGSIVSEMNKDYGECDKDCYSRSYSSPEQKLLNKERNVIIDKYLTEIDKMILSGEKSIREFCNESGMNRKAFTKLHKQRLETLRKELGVI